MSPDTVDDPLSIVLVKQGAELTPFQDMTYPLFVPLLQRIGTDPRYLAAAARWAGQPVGLALAEMLPSDSGLVRSVYVEPEARRKGAGSRLLALLEQEIRARGGNRLIGSYARNPAVDGLLARQGWSPPEPSMYLFHVDRAAMQAMEKAPIYRGLDLGPGQELVAWGELTAQDHASIAEAVNQFQVPAGLTASTEPALIDPDLSLAVRIQGRISLWLLVHRTAPERRRYTGLYARPDCPVKGLAIRLVFESLRRRLAQIRDTPEADATWGCIADMPMAGFSLRRLVPFLPGIRVTETMTSFKRLVAEDGR